MPELGVRKELPAGKERGADAGAEGEHDDRAGAIAAAAEAHLGDAGGVGVVQHQHRTPERLRGERLAIGADPALIDVGGRERRAALDDARERYPGPTADA